MCFIIGVIVIGIINKIGFYENCGNINCGKFNYVVFLIFDILIL